MNRDTGSPGNPVPGGNSGTAGQVHGSEVTSGQAPSDQGMADRQVKADASSSEAGAEYEAEAIARLRKELADAPVEVVLVNHVAGIFELATIYMTSNPPKLPQAQLAIDAMGALLSGLKGRLGEAEKTMEDALAQIRIAYVQVANSQRTGNSKSDDSYGGDNRDKTNRQSKEDSQEEANHQSGENSQSEDHNGDNEYL